MSTTACHICVEATTTASARMRYTIPRRNLVSDREPSARWERPILLGEI